ncbi:choice-of-anchor A family protein [Cellulosimicrobium sp. CUA-896]|uniref:choice-of-anchor A family protein n=1 Tax=Cellulosimicrobium sp. CUA-896 TaxID=1517881 RepID=UPI000961C4D8|nr:choice-of-anchor A family protein [Cellulosimicrobium sp. CUA-896]OLT55193.1 hypothetical protein BJF88_06955 [Cellulosimicrobium sp. CUA-896]
MPRARHRAHPLAALVLAPGLAAAVLAAPAVAVTPPSEATTRCDADGTLAGLSSDGPVATDDGVAVLVGGSYTALPGATETEGVLAVVGNVRVATGGRFNVGRAGGGSQIVPPAGTAMLVAGGRIDATGSVVDVGHGLVGADGSGGDVVAGGHALPADAFETNGGVVMAHGGQDVAASLQGLRDRLTTLSAGLAAQPATGTAVLTGDQLTLTAGEPADVHVFDVRAEDLAVARSLLYVGTGTSPVVVDVAGADVDYGVLHTAVGTLAARVDEPGGTTIGPAAARTLWNLADATTVDLGDGTTTSQLVGSVLVPREGSVVRQRTHTNGRLWVGGDLVVGGAPGLEHHSYPWAGAEDLDCTPGTAPSTPPVPADPDGGQDDVDPEAPSDPPATEEPPGAAETPDGPDDVTHPVGTTEPVAGGAPAGTTGPGPRAAAVRVTTASAVGQQEPSTPSAGRELVATGASTLVPASASAALLAAGAVLLAASRRRRATR